MSPRRDADCRLSPVLFQRILLVCLISVWLHNSAFPVIAGSLEIDADTQLAYADYCFENQEYLTAAAAYEKFLYFFPSDARAVTASYQVGMAYFHAKSYERALNRFTRILDQHGLTDVGVDSAFMISRCYERMGNYSSAVDNLLYVRRMTEDPDLADKINYRLGWLFLETGDFESARTAFARIRPVGKPTFNTQGLADHLNAYDHVPKKNPITAGVLSIVPGGGYLYCGRYRDALVSFLVNSALIAGAVESFDNGLYAIGGIISVVELGFYAGNIYGGISSARKYNKMKQTEFLQGLKKTFNADVSVTGGSSTIGMAMTCRF